jgi:DNA polymerase V
MSKKVPIYFSEDSFSILKVLMGTDGSPSQTVNHLLQNLSFLEGHGFQTVLPKTQYSIPVALESIPTGFPSPAADYVDKTVDLNELLISNPNATFLNVIKSSSMVDAGLEIGDVVVVDRSKEPKHRSIVVALIDEKELTIKRLMITSQMSRSEIDEVFGPEAENIPETWLKAESSEYSNIYLSDCQSFKAIAVVTWNLKNLINQ